MKKKILARLLLSVFAFTSLSLHLSPFSTALDDHVFAETLSGSSPYTKTFTVSAYYSPLPCQSRYATGSYAGDIRLNGSGVNSADGTPVYPGMIAAPKTYSFGTKMDIPGVGIVAVHDRGGAIIPGGGREGVYDRLDVWMGYGDAGLQRALKWGKRSIDVVVYGVNDSIAEQVILPGYDPSEANASNCSGEPVVQPQTNTVIEQVEEEEKVSGLTSNLQIGSRGSEVIALQAELKALNYLRIEPTGYYGPVTEHAVFKFQQSQSLAGSKASLGAGVFGPKTRNRMNEILAARHYTGVLVAQATEEYSEDGSLVASDSASNQNL